MTVAHHLPQARFDVHKRRRKPALALARVFQWSIFAQRSSTSAFTDSRRFVFNLGTYATGVTRYVTFDRPGLVEVLCNVHHEMIAHIVVLPGHLFTVTDEAGRYRVERSERRPRMHEPDSRAGLIGKVYPPYFLSLNSARAVPFTGMLTVRLCGFLARGCHAVTVYSPAGTPSSTNVPSAPAIV